MTRGFPKRGAIRSVSRGSTVGYWATQDHCQVAVSLTLAHEVVSVPAAYRLYLPNA